MPERKTAISSFGLERLGLVCVQWPRLGLSAVILVTLLAIASLPRLQIDQDLGSLFRSDTPSDRAYRTLLEKFPGVEKNLLLLIESKNRFTGSQLTALRDLHLELQFIEGVNGVTSIFSARHAPNGNGVAELVIPDELPQNPAGIAELLNEVQQHPLVLDLLLSKDQRASLFLVSLARESWQSGQSQRLLQQTAEIYQPLIAGLGLEVLVTGSVPVSHAVFTALFRDVHILNLTGIALTFLLAVFFLQHFVLVITVMLPPICAVLWTIGGFSIFGHPLNALNNVLPVLILAIAFSDALHMVQSIRRHMVAGNYPETAVRQTVNRVAPACAITSVTTAIAFASLLLSPSEAIRGFGGAGAIAVMSAYLAVVTLLPALVLIISKAYPAVFAVPETNRAGTLLRRINRRMINIGYNRGRLIIAITCITLAITILSYAAISTNYDYRNYLSSQSAANRAIDRINLVFGGADHFQIIVTPPAQSETPPGGIPDILSAVHREVEKSPGIRGVFSTLTVKRWANADGGQSNNSIIDDLPLHFKDRLISRDGDSYLVSAYILATGAYQSRAAFDALETRLQPIREQYPGAGITITGLTPLGAYSSHEVIDKLKTSLLLAVVVTICVIAISARSAMIGFLAAIPNVLPLTLLVAFLFITGSALQYSAIMALTIAFGIAVDNTIHIVNRYRLISADPDHKDPLGAALDHVGPVLLMATFLLCAGLSVTQISQLPVVSQFGRYTIIVLICALVVAITVLPAFIRHIDKRSE